MHESVENEEGYENEEHQEIINNEGYQEELEGEDAEGEDVEDYDEDDNDDDLYGNDDYEDRVDNEDDYAPGPSKRPARQQPIIEISDDELASAPGPSTGNRLSTSQHEPSRSPSISLWEERGLGKRKRTEDDDEDAGARSAKALRS